MTVGRDNTAIKASPPTLDYSSPRTETKIRHPFLRNPPWGRVLSEVLLLPMLFLWSGNADDRIWTFYYVFWLPASLAIAVRFLWRWADPRALSCERKNLLWWRVALAICFVQGLLSARWDECPHATYFAIGPWAWVTRGEACGNARHFRSYLWYPFEHGRVPS
jgi:hypothetical protein